MSIQQKITSGAMLMQPSVILPRKRLLSAAIGVALLGGLSHAPTIKAAAAFPAVLQLSALDGINGFRLDGAGNGDESGVSVSGLGDINGDGIDDLIIGANKADPTGNFFSNAGSSYVVFGKDTAFTPTMNLSSLNGNNGFRLDGIAIGDYTGDSVSAAGDINGDGIDDLIIGTFRADLNGANSGSSYIIFGQSTAFLATMSLSSLDGNNGFRVDGVAVSDYSGDSVSAAGDINNDGIDDLIIGASRADPNPGVEGSGSSYVIFGSSTVAFASTMNLSSLNGTNGFRLDGGNVTREQSGASVSAAGDVNGDGIDDLIIGAEGTNLLGSYTGSAYVVFGRGTAFAATIGLTGLDGNTGFRLDGVTAFERTGFSVSAAGDINGDGIDDLIVGAPYANLPVSNAGNSYVVFGQSTAFTPVLSLSSLDGSNGFRLDGVVAEDFAGYSVSGAGDINGDNFSDLIIGARGADTNGDQSGSSYVVFGRSTAFTATMSLSSLDGSNGFRLDGGTSGIRSGTVVNAAGDVNKDGIDDLIIGANKANQNVNNSGSSYVVFGSNDILHEEIFQDGFE